MAQHQNILMIETTNAAPTASVGEGPNHRDFVEQSKDIARLQQENDKLERRLREMAVGLQSDQNVQRATLNLLEDAVAARQAADREIAKRKRVEVELNDADVRKDEFLAMLAHELRNPLAAIHSAGQLLLSEESNAATRHHAAEILNRQAAHMMRQVDDLLDVSRISCGKIELRMELATLNEVINQAIEGIRPLCERSGHQLIVTIPPEQLHVRGDSARLVQVIGNLLSNACKFTPEGGRIQLDMGQEDSRVLISIRDNGIGIDAGELSRVFEIFAQVNRSIGRANEGLGLGLSLVKTLVEMHGGSVEARSAGHGHGSEFVVSLPAAQCPQSSQIRSGVHFPATASRRVLVVDDNEDVAMAMSMLLTLNGHQVKAVHNGLAAIEAVSRGEFDVIILDIGMPGIGGYEVARRIRQQGQSGLKLVALTGWGQETDRRLSKEAGFDIHLVKPVETDVLLEVVSRLAG